MVEKALKLLSEMASEYDKNGTTEFDAMFYLDTPDSVIDILEDLDYIRKKNNIIGSITLTRSGYEKAKQ